MFLQDTTTVIKIVKRENDCVYGLDMYYTSNSLCEGWVSLWEFSALEIGSLVGGKS